MLAASSTKTIVNDWKLSDLLDTMNSVHLIIPPFKLVTCKPKVFETPGVEGSKNAHGATENGWHLIMKPGGCFLPVAKGIYRELSDILAQLPGFKLPSNSLLRY
ncbi:hypothetical protein V5O48_015393 [Marasmius crinis-equi]|uniref:Uncharacterized protein n=1 Tax=Marasmius crinis-equi TaxID=585013 RepID=A0ABR3EUN0_9AGAR